MLIFSNPDGAVLLIKRPPSGIWGGLWSFPEVNLQNDELPYYCRKEYEVEIINCNSMPQVKHGFTHFELEINPILCEVSISNDRIMDAEQQLWYNVSSNNDIAVPTAIKKIFKLLIQR